MFYQAIKHIKSVFLHWINVENTRLRLVYFLISFVFSNARRVLSGSLKWHYDENRIFPIKVILKHEQEFCIGRKLLFTVLKYLFSFQRYSSF